MPKKLTEGEIAARIARIGDQFAVSGDFLYGEELRNGHINTTYRACYRTKNTGVGSLSLLQRIFPTQESNPGLLHCRRIRYQLSYQGS